MFSKLQYISQGATAGEQLNNIQQALDAGCEWIQLRFKNGTANDTIALATDVKKICTNYKATFIINDHPHIAHAADADGVHLGLSDLSISEAKKILAPNKIIGGTANTFNDVLKRVAEGCNYVGLGPLRFTSTKQKLSPILGLQGYKLIMDDLTAKKIQVPVYAIGGIVLDDMEAIVNTGVYGVAVSGSISNHANKKLLVKQLNTFMYDAVNHRQ